MIISIGYRLCINVKQHEFINIFRSSINIIIIISTIVIIIIISIISIISTIIIIIILFP